MADQHFLFLGHQDLYGLLRGRSVPKERHELAMTHRLPWVPTNYSIGPTNVLPPDNPFGTMGEIRLLPDLDIRLTLPAYNGKPVFDIVLCDTHQTDGTPWPCCPRGALKAAGKPSRKRPGPGRLK